MASGWAASCSRYSSHTSEDRRCSASSTGASVAAAFRILGTTTTIVSSLGRQAIEGRREVGVGPNDAAFALWVSRRLDQVRTDADHGWPRGESMLVGH